MRLNCTLTELMNFLKPFQSLTELVSIVFATVSVVPLVIRLKFVRCVQKLV